LGLGYPYTPKGVCFFLFFFFVYPHYASVGGLALFLFFPSGPSSPPAPAFQPLQSNFPYLPSGPRKEKFFFLRSFSRTLILMEFPKRPTRHFSLHDSSPYSFFSFLPRLLVFFFLVLAVTFLFFVSLRSFSRLNSISTKVFFHCFPSCRFVKLTY